MWLMVLCQQGALAGSVHLTPVRINLTASQPSAVLTVPNEGAAETLMQLDTAAWTQQAGQDRYTPTRDILATPSVFSLAPGEQQIVRVGLRKPASARLERAYRLFLQEVPVAEPQKAAVKVALRFALPVFVKPQQALPPATLSWQAIPAAPSRLRLVASNPGRAHLQISRLIVTAGSDAMPAIELGQMHYLLPGQHRDWQLELPKGLPRPDRLNIVALTDAGEIEAEVPVAP